MCFHHDLRFLKSLVQFSSPISRGFVVMLIMKTHICALCLLLNPNLFSKLSFVFSFTRYLNFSQRYKENPIYSMPSNPIYKKIGGQNKKSGSERLLQIYSSFRKSNLFKWKRKPLGCETFSSDWPLFAKFCQNWPHFFPT